MSITPRTYKAYQSQGKCINGVFYVPESEMRKLEEEFSTVLAAYRKLAALVKGVAK